MRLLEYKQPDLALVDLGLPDGSGLDLIARVRAADGVASRLDPGLAAGRADRALRRARPRARASTAAPTTSWSSRSPIRSCAAGCAAILRRMQPRRRLGPAAGRRPRGRPARRARCGCAGGASSCRRRSSRCCARWRPSPTRVFTKEELLRDVWGFRSMGATRTLDSHACRLRQKLGTARRPFVVNVWGVGYRLVDGPAERRRRRERGWRTPAGWRRCARAGGSSRCCGCGSSRHAELVADAGHELRGPLCAARLGLHGLDDVERAAAVDLELRRAALALDDLVAAGRGRRAGVRSQLVDVGALLDDAAEAWRAAGARRSGPRWRSSRCAAARSSAPTRSGSPRRAATSWPTRVEHGGVVPCACAGACSRGGCASRSTDAGPGLARAGAGDAAPRARAGRRASAARGASASPIAARGAALPRQAASPSRAEPSTAAGLASLDLAERRRRADRPAVLELPCADRIRLRLPTPMTRRRRGALLIGLALALGGLAASDVGRREAAVRAQLAPLVDVVVAGRDLPPRRRLCARRPRAPPHPGPLRPGRGGLRARGGASAAARPPPCRAAPTSARASSRTSRRRARPAIRRGERAVEVAGAGSPELVVAGARVDVVVVPGARRRAARAHRRRRARRSPAGGGGRRGRGRARRRHAPCHRRAGAHARLARGGRARGAAARPHGLRGASPARPPPP